MPLCGQHITHHTYAPYHCKVDVTQGTEWQPPVPPADKPPEAEWFKTIMDDIWQTNILPRLDVRTGINFAATCREAHNMAQSILPSGLNHVATDGSADPVTGQVGAAVVGQTETGCGKKSSKYQAFNRTRGRKASGSWLPLP